MKYLSNAHNAVPPSLSTCDIPTTYNRQQNDATRKKGLLGKVHKIFLAVGSFFQSKKKSNETNAEKFTAISFEKFPRKRIIKRNY